MKHGWITGAFWVSLVVLAILVGVNVLSDFDLPRGLVFASAIVVVVFELLEKVVKRKEKKGRLG